jgi:pimeloyl-ACP methyl ester carboxylesterase
MAALAKAPVAAAMALLNNGLLSFSGGSELSAETGVEETVVLVHGLWMRGWVMALLGLRLRRCGFHVVAFSYPSVRCSLSQNARRLSRFAADIAGRRLHFVGHSLGGLVVLQMLAEFPQARSGRVVLMGTPYRTSHSARRMARTALGRGMIGRGLAGLAQWLEQKAHVGTVGCEVGAIAGCRGIGFGRLLGGLPRPNDGVVSVDETRVPGALDHTVLKVSHSGMLVSAAVARQVCAFLKDGHFLQDSKPS